VVPPAPAPPPEGWRQVAPIQRAVAMPSLISPASRMQTSLTSWRDPSFVAPLGHAVSADAPAGMVHDLPVPVQTAAQGPELIMPTPPADRGVRAVVARAVAAFSPPPPVPDSSSPISDSSPAGTDAGPTEPALPLAVPPSPVFQAPAAVQRMVVPEPPAPRFTTASDAGLPVMTLPAVPQPDLAPAPVDTSGDLGSAPTLGTDTPLAETPPADEQASVQRATDAPPPAPLPTAAGPAPVQRAATAPHLPTTAPHLPSAPDAPTLPQTAPSPTEPTLGTSLPAMPNLPTIPSPVQRSVPEPASIPRPAPVSAPSPVQRSVAGPASPTDATPPPVRRLGLGAPLLPLSSPMDPAPSTPDPGLPLAAPEGGVSGTAPSDTPLVAAAPSGTPPSDGAAAADPSPAEPAAEPAEVASLLGDAPPLLQRSVAEPEPPGPAQETPVAPLPAPAGSVAPDAASTRPALGTTPPIVARSVADPTGAAPIGGSTPSTPDTPTSAGLAVQRAATALPLLSAPRPGPTPPAGASQGPAGTSGSDVTPALVPGPLTVVARLLGDRSLPLRAAPEPAVATPDAATPPPPAPHPAATVQRWTDPYSGPTATASTSGSSPATAHPTSPYQPAAVQRAALPMHAPAPVPSMAAPAMPGMADGWLAPQPGRDFPPGLPVQRAPDLFGAPSPGTPHPGWSSGTPVGPVAVQRAVAAEAAPAVRVEYAGGPVQVVSRDADPAAETVAETAPPTGTPEPATAAAAPPGATQAPGAPAAGGTPEELLAKLFDPLLRRLKTELRLDRERRGSLTDLRH